jgi:hypothetical protein
MMKADRLNLVSIRHVLTFTHHLSYLETPELIAQYLPA